MPLHGEFANQSEFFAGHQAADVHQNQYALVDGAKADEIVGTDGGIHFRRWFDLFVGGIMSETLPMTLPMMWLSMYVSDDHHGEPVDVGIAELEHDAHVDDRQDVAAQIDRALDVVRTVGLGVDALLLD